MSAEKTLSEIRKSLQPQVPKANFDSIRHKVEALKTVDPNLIDLTRLSTDILAFIGEREAEGDLLSKLDGFALSLNELSHTANDTLQKVASLQQRLDKRIEQFNLTEAKYQRLIVNVETVLDELERFLRNV